MMIKLSFKFLIFCLISLYFFFVFKTDNWKIMLVKIVEKNYFFYKNVVFIVLNCTRENFQEKSLENKLLNKVN